MSSLEQVEINFRLDEQGRTIPGAAHVMPSAAADDDGAERKTTAQESSTTNGSNVPLLVDYTTHIRPTHLSWSDKVHPANRNLLSHDDSTDPPLATVDHLETALDEVLYDCEIADCGLMPRTFWVPACEETFQPRFNLEQMALDIFRHHTAQCAPGSFDVSSSGAEWWVQIRPSPETTGRYAMFDHPPDKNNNAVDKKATIFDPSANHHDLSKTGISFHWDKDEELRLLCGGTTYVHPHLSTVTYLTGIGAPTLVLNCRVHNLTGEYLVPHGIENPGIGDANDQESNPQDKNRKEEECSAWEAFVSWPQFGKHLSFDGRFLHAAPGNLLEEGAFEKQMRFEVDPEKSKGGDGLTTKKLQRRHRRVTFLVNVWLNYHPFGVHPFPETMVSKMSGHSDGEKIIRLTFSDVAPVKTVIATEKESNVDQNGTGKLSGQDNSDITTTFSWPMGDCDSHETIQVVLPLGAVRSEAKKGGTVQIKWKSSHGVQLLTDDQQRHVQDEKPVKRARLDERAEGEPSC